MSQLEGRLAGSGCSLRNKFSPKEIRRWLEGGSGRFARRVGNLLQAFICVPRVASIMEMDPRFAEIPVLVDGTVQFIDVETLVFKVHVVQEPCNSEGCRRLSGDKPWSDSCKISNHDQTQRRGDI